MPPKPTGVKARVKVCAGWGAGARMSVEAGVEAGVEAEVWAAFVAAVPSWRDGDVELGERLSRGAAVRTC